MDLAGLTSCRELSTEHVDEAARSIEKLRALLARVAEIAEPEDGAPKVLIVFARLARGDIGWLEGDVTVEVAGNDEHTTIDLFKEEGWGIKERLAPQAKLRVPFDEFERAVEISAKRFVPLHAQFDARRPYRFALTSVADAVPGASVEPPIVELDEKSLGTAPPPPPPLGMPQEPEPFELPPPSEPEPFAPGVEDSAEVEAGFGAFSATPELDDPLLGAAIVSPKKKSVAIPEPTPEPATKPATSATPGAAKPKGDPVHSRPTVRRMVAIKPEALRTGRKDPRREDDD